MTRTLVLSNHKGGVGKSTSATNIAFGLVQVLRTAGAPNLRVLLVDTDSQGHATLVDHRQQRLWHTRQPIHRTDSMHRVC